MTYYHVVKQGNVACLQCFVQSTRLSQVSCAWECVSGRVVMYQDYACSFALEGFAYDYSVVYYCRVQTA